jgi:hypothetical protein
LPPIAVDKLGRRADNQGMGDATDRMVAEFKKACLKMRREHAKDPRKSRDFLIQAGIAEKDPKRPGKLRLVKDLR